MGSLGPLRRLRDVDDVPVPARIVGVEVAVLVADADQLEAMDVDVEPVDGARLVPELPFLGRSEQRRDEDRP
jgi:hypothetical protein